MAGRSTDREFPLHPLALLPRTLPRPAALLALLPLFAALLLGGCCAAPEVVGVSILERFELSSRERVAVLGAVLDDPRAWAYGEPQAAIAALSSHYRVGLAPEVLPTSEAPQPLRSALESLGRGLSARGYRLAGPADAPQAYVSLSLSSESGRVVRIGLHVGGTHEGTFHPRAISLVIAEAEGPDPCPLELEAELGRLVEALPAAARQP